MSFNDPFVLLSSSFEVTIIVCSMYRMLVEFVWIDIVIVVESVVKLWMTVMGMLVPMVFVMVLWYMSCNHSSFMLLSSTCEVTKVILPGVRVR